MSTQSKTVCDMCGLLKPTDYNKQKGWAYVSVTGEDGHKDFCGMCWKPIARVLLRNFVDGLLLEAQGIEEIK